MLTIPVKEDLGLILFDSSFPKNDFDSGEQKTNKNGLPLWSISCLLRQEGSRRSENITVVIPAKGNPADVIEPLSQLQFDGLRILTGQQNGKTWIAFHADKVGLVK